MNKSLNIIIYALIGLIILVVIFLFVGGNNTQKNELIFSLYGEENVDHNLGDPYFDPGFKLIDNGVDKVSEVVVSGTVDTSKEGTYTKTYTYKDKTLTRTINVKKLNNFTLNGESEVYILLNGKYNDPKVEATYQGNDYKDNIEVTSNIDFTKAGVYTVTYKFKEINKTLQRKVYVSNFAEYLKINYDVFSINSQL